MNNPWIIKIDDGFVEWEYVLTGDRGDDWSIRDILNLITAHTRMSVESSRALGGYVSKENAYLCKLKRD